MTFFSGHQVPILLSYRINLISQGVSFEHNITKDKGEKGEQLGVKTKPLKLMNLYNLHR